MYVHNVARANHYYAYIVCVCIRKYNYAVDLQVNVTGNNSYVTVQPTPCCAPAIVDVPLSSSSLRASEEPSYERLSMADLQ